MGGQHKAQPKPEQLGPEAYSFLQQLIDEPPQSAHTWRPAVALRSVDEQRRHALRRYSLRTWFDHTLKHTERILIIFGLIFFGYWLYDGPMRDWMHEHAIFVTPSAAHTSRSQSQARTQGAAQVNQDSQDAANLRTAPLPYISDAMAQEQAGGDFLAPGLSLVPSAARQSSTPKKLRIPSISLDTPVKEVFVVDGTWEVADYAAGYMHGTALPGEKGTMAFAGHAGIRGAVFRDLPSMALNDAIFVEADGWQYRYQVSSFDQVWPTQTEVLALTPDPTLILITCTNWDTQRFIVRAKLVESKPITVP